MRHAGGEGPPERATGCMRAPAEMDGGLERRFVAMDTKASSRTKSAQPGPEPRAEPTERAQPPGKRVRPTPAGAQPAPLGAQPAPVGDELPPDFDAWFRDHREAVYRYVRFRVPTRDVAEDLTSDVFLKALRSLERYDPTKSAPRTWLLRIARNAVTDYLRTLQRRGRLHVSLDHAPDLVYRAPSQEERMLHAEQVQRLLNAVATLRAADQEILSLRYGAGLANLEIAKTLNISANAVAVRVHRALSRLKAAVGETPGAED